MSTADAALAFFDDAFRRAGSAPHASAAKAYLKVDLRFYGADVPTIRASSRAYARSNPDLTRRDLRAIAERLWATETYELRSAAIGLLEARRGVLTDADLLWLARLSGRSGTWAHVDWIAPKVIGDVLARYPASRRVLATWAKDPSFWVRRTALLAQLDALRHGEGDFALFARLARPMLGEREFFIRKAIGWVLRDVSRKRPELAFEFLRENRDRVSTLTLREGAKYLAPSQRRALRLPGKPAWMLRDERRSTAP